jgi:hypothetical protein
LGRAKRPSAHKAERTFGEPVIFVFHNAAKAVLVLRFVSRVFQMTLEL